VLSDMVPSAFHLVVVCSWSVVCDFLKQLEEDWSRMNVELSPTKEVLEAPRIYTPVSRISHCVTRPDGRKHCIVDGR
jgi:hypothetical protein